MLKVNGTLVSFSWIFKIWYSKKFCVCFFGSFFKKIIQFVWCLCQLFFFRRVHHVKVLRSFLFFASEPVSGGSTPTAINAPSVHTLGSGCRTRLPYGPQAPGLLRKMFSHLTTLLLPPKGKDNFCHFQCSRIVHAVAENQCIFRLLIVYFFLWYFNICFVLVWF